MDKQQEQMNQNPNQEVEYISAFLDEDEEVNESDFDEPAREQEKAGNLADKQQNKPEEEQKKSKRPRKTIEQEIAELDAKRERLMEKKRRKDAHEKIIFGSTIMAMLSYLRINDNDNFKIIYNIISKFIHTSNIKDKEILDKIISNIK